MLIRMAYAAALLALAGLGWDTVGSVEPAVAALSRDAYTSQLFLDYLHSVFAMRW